MSASPVRAFHHVTAEELKGLWWILEWDPGISRRETLISIVLVLCTDFILVTLRFVRWGTYIICTLCCTDRAATLLQCSRLSSGVVCCARSSFSS